MRRLVINADDFGYDPAITRGIVESMRCGIVSSTTFMVNTPHSSDAAPHARGLSVGLHLNLARWQSLSDPGRTFAEHEAPVLPSAFVERETLAQLERLEQLTGTAATHIDVHKHLHRFHNVLHGVIAAAQKAGLPVRSPDDDVRRVLRDAGVTTNDVMLGDADVNGEAFWSLTRLEAHLLALPDDGFVELMCHPGYAPTTVSSGYAAQRETELVTFTSPQAKALLDAVGVPATGW